MNKKKVLALPKKSAPAKAQSAAVLRDLPPRKDPRGGRRQEQGDK